MKKEIEELLNSDLTSYRIAKETGITKQQIARYRKSSKVGNITLDNAIKLYDYYKRRTRKMIKLTIKKNNKEIYGATIEDATREAFEYFKNDEYANELYEKGEFLNEYCEVEYYGEDIVYFKDIPYLCDFTFLETENFIKELSEDLKQYIKKDEYNDLYYIEYNLGAYQIADQLEELAEGK